MYCPFVMVFRILNSEIVPRSVCCEHGGSKHIRSQTQGYTEMSNGLGGRGNGLNLIAAY